MAVKMYIATTADIYELPIAVADNGKELAKMLGTTPATIYTYISRQKSGTYTRGKGRQKCPYLVYKIEEE
jgi:transposase